MSADVRQAGKLNLLGMSEYTAGMAIHSRPMSGADWALFSHGIARISIPGLSSFVGNPEAHIYLTYQADAKSENDFVSIWLSDGKAKGIIGAKIYFDGYYETLADGGRVMHQKLTPEQIEALFERIFEDVDFGVQNSQPFVGNVALFPTPPVSDDRTSAQDPAPIKDASTFDVSGEVEEITINVEWANQDANVSVILLMPDGTVVHQSEFDQLENFGLVKLVDGSGAIVTLTDPMVGTWTYALQSSDDLGTVLTDTRDTGALVDHQLQEPTVDPETAQGTVVVTSQNINDDYQVQIFADKDQNGFDGTPVSEQGTINADGDLEVSLDLSALEAGDYYLYSVINGENAVPDMNYSNALIEIFTEDDPNDPPLQEATLAIDLLNTDGDQDGGFEIPPIVIVGLTAVGIAAGAAALGWGTNAQGLDDGF